MKTNASSTASAWGIKRYICPCEASPLLLFLVVSLSCIGCIHSAIGDVCSGANPCTDAVNHVCEITAPNPTGTCKLKANGVSTGCTQLTECPTNALCAASVCNCNAGYTVVTSGTNAGLCTAVLRMTCTANTMCSSALPNTNCLISSPCTRGVCQCDTGYIPAGPVCSAVTVPKSYGEQCQVATDTCSATLACTGGTCQCANPAYVYKVSLQLCTDKSVFGEACTQVTDCYVAAAGNGACPNQVCGCATGYIEATLSTCRLPYRDEQCEIASGCQVTINSGEQSSVRPTCQSGVCNCSAGSSQFDRLIGTCSKLCLTDYAGAGPLLGVGDTCTQSNECSSKTCHQCPGDASRLCYSAECPGTSGNTAVKIVLPKALFISAAMVWLQITYM